jgi:peptide/nickel transport system permease protein
MLVFIVRRVLTTIPVVFMTTLIIFVLMRMLPGDPVMMLIGEGHQVSDETVETLRRQHGLDQPVVVQYVLWLTRTLTGDFGLSIHTRQPVLDVVWQRMLPTVHIGLTAWVFAIVVAIPLGVYSARRLNTWPDWLGTVLALVGASMPYFLIGGLLIYFVALRWGALPASGYVSPATDLWQSIRSTILPAITLSLGLLAVLSRQARSSFADVLQHPHIRTARAKGLSETSVIMRHAFRNAMLPIATILGLQLGMLFSGTVITETVFAVPGLGRLLVDAILGRDYPVVQGVVLFITFAVVAANLAVDIAYGILDPRTRER